MFLLLNGCFLTKPHSVLDKGSAANGVVPVAGHEAKIAVNDFELKTSGVNPQISFALKEYLVSILNNSKRFVVVAPQKADLVINVAIVGFIPENSGGRSGLAGGGSSASSFMGGLLGDALNQANMQLSLKIIDRVSSEVIATKDIQSQVVERAGKKVHFAQDKFFRASFSDYVGTPWGKVFYDCIVEAGRFVVQNVPQNYYKG